MKKVIIILIFIIIICIIIGGGIYINSCKSNDEDTNNSNELIKNIIENNDLHINIAKSVKNDDINEIQQKSNNNETNTNSKTRLSDTTQKTVSNSDNTKTTTNNDKNTQTTNNNNKDSQENNKKNNHATTNNNKNKNGQKTNVKDKSSNKINLSKYDFYEKGPNGSYKGFIKDKTGIDNLKKLIDDAIKEFGYKIINVKPDSSLAKSGTRYFTANKTNVENEVYDSDGFSIYYYAVKEYIISANGTEKYFQTRSYIKVK